MIDSLISKNTWVSIKKIILEPERRTSRIPDETKATPFIMWAKGRLQRDSQIGDEVTVITRTGRLESGVLEEANPQYILNYGDFIEELLTIGDDARAILFGDSNE